MRIVIDLQGAQSTGSRNRGIGRYSLSLAKAIVRNKGSHEVFIVLNGMFPETINPLRLEFQSLLPADNIYVWSCFPSVSFLNKNRIYKRKVSEKIREAFIANLNPDIVLITSLFEGSGDDAITSIGKFSSSIPTASILYDLIPFIYPSPYLDNTDVKEWYEEKIKYLKKVDILLSISESSRQEALQYLDFPEDKVSNIGTAADSQFRQICMSRNEEDELRNKYGFKKSILMYTGGIDHRKNIEGLIHAFALLEKDLRENYQLAIVCSIDIANKERFQKLALKEGLTEHEVILTGYVPEDDLIALYNISKAFIFPSWHEGFGLPALEAMWCGIPVITANSSSLPEVIGLQEALFDPKDDFDMAKKIEQVLEDEDFRNRLVEHNQKQIKKFSWDISAQKAIDNMQKYHLQTTNQDTSVVQKYKLAYISPLPPARSGIADYSAELLSELIKEYDIDVILNEFEISDDRTYVGYEIKSVEWFKKNHRQYDRVLYHFGNSQFHEHMFDLLENIHGVVVLHDFFLSGIISHLDMSGDKPNYWVYNLYYSHGYNAVKEYFYAKDLTDIIGKYPANFRILQNALKVIVHSQNSVRLAKQYYGDCLTNNLSVIPLLRVPPGQTGRVRIREKLGFPKDAFIICSYGFLAKTKLNKRLLQAYMHSSLVDNENCYLFFVGENESGEYGDNLISMIQNSQAKERIKITGWVDTELYHDYLAVADVGVQLRTLSRGETSAAVLDCMNYGLATIVNAHGSMADLPQDAVWMLSDDFTDEALIKAMETLYSDGKYRMKLAKNAEESIRRDHSPEICAQKYSENIEHVYNSVSTAVLPKLTDSLKMNEAKKLNQSELLELAQHLGQNFPHAPRQKQLFLDITELIESQIKIDSLNIQWKLLKELIENQPQGFRVEPVYFHWNTGRYYYAREFMSVFLEYTLDILIDEQIDAYAGDIFWGMSLQGKLQQLQENFLSTLDLRGIKVCLTADDILSTMSDENFMGIKLDNTMKQLIQNFGKEDYKNIRF